MSYATTEELATALHIRETPGNVPVLQACLDAAAAEMDHEMDRLEPVPDGDALANRVNLVRASEWFKANDGIFGSLGFDQSGVLYPPKDSFNRHAFELTPLKQQWGLA